MSASGFRSFVLTADDVTGDVIYRTLYALGYRPQMVEEDITIEGPMENVIVFCGLSELSDLLDQEGWGQPGTRPRIILTMTESEIDAACAFLPLCDGMLFTDIGLERLDSAVELALDGYCTLPARSEASPIPAGDDLLEFAEGYPGGH